MKRIGKNVVVTLNYDVTDPEGIALDAGEAPLVYLHGGYDDIFAAIEEALEGKGIGESVTVKLQPDQAFGEYDAGLIHVEAVERLPQPLEVGMQIEADSGEGGGESRFYRVTEIAGGTAVLDGNHPLAGMALVFRGTVTGLRPPRTEEIAAGRAL